MRIALRTSARGGTTLNVGVKIGGRSYLWRLSCPCVEVEIPQDLPGTPMLPEYLETFPWVSSVMKPQVIIDTNI